MPKFRKKTAVIDAYKFEKKIGPDTWPEWLTDAVKSGTAYFQGGENPYLTIETLAGEMRVNLGDYVVRGVYGELYPCKEEIFLKTYEPAE